jgi:hypothetical protein
MSESNPFAEFVRRIRAGDEQAARELVRKYEPMIRCEVRLLLEADRQRCRLFDSNWRPSARKRTRWPCANSNDDVRWLVKETSSRAEYGGGAIHRRIIRGVECAL